MVMSEKSEIRFGKENGNKLDNYNQFEHGNSLIKNEQEKSLTTTQKSTLC